VHLHKNWGNPLRVPTKGAKTCFVFLTQNLRGQRGLSATYSAPISTIFETKDVDRRAHAYTGENFPISSQGGLQAPKQLKWIISRRMLVHGRGRPTAQTAQFRAMGIVSVDVPFVREFWCGRMV